MGHFLQSILLLGLLVGRKFRVEPGSCADQAQPGAAQAKRAASAKLRAWSRDGKIGRGRLSRSHAAAVRAATKKSSRPCAFVRSSLHAACRTSLHGQPRAAPVIRPGRRRRWRYTAPYTRPHLRSYIGKSKSNLKLKRWIAVTKCTSLKSQGKAAICSTDTHYITTKKKK